MERARDVDLRVCDGVLLRANVRWLVGVNVVVAEVGWASDARDEAHQRGYGLHQIMFHGSWIAPAAVDHQDAFEVVGTQGVGVSLRVASLVSSCAGSSCFSCCSFAGSSDLRGWPGVLGWVGDAVVVDCFFARFAAGAAVVPVRSVERRRDDLPTVPVSPAVACPVERRPAFERVDLREFIIGAKSVFWFVAAVRSAVCDSRLRTLRAVLRT